MLEEPLKLTIIPEVALHIPTIFGILKWLWQVLKILAFPCFEAHQNVMSEHSKARCCSAGSRSICRNMRRLRATEHPTDCSTATSPDHRLVDRRHSRPYPLAQNWHADHLERRHRTLVCNGLSSRRGGRSSLCIDAWLACPRCACLGVPCHTLCLSIIPGASCTVRLLFMV